MISHDILANHVYAIPTDTREAIDRYVRDHLEPGGFLSAVLCNDLRGACERADTQNRPALWHIVNYLYNQCPANCWGSEARVTAWLETPL